MQPFGALDLHHPPSRSCAANLLVDLGANWSGKTIVFVQFARYRLKAVQLADRVVVMMRRTAGQTGIQREVTIDIAHPRDISSRRYLELRDGIFEEIGLAHKI